MPPLQDTYLRGWVTDYLADALLNHSVRGVAFVPPETIWLQSHRGAPGPAGADNQIGNPDERVVVEFSPPVQPVGEPGFEVGNAARVLIPDPGLGVNPPTDNPFVVQETVTHLSVWDGNTLAANCLGRIALAGPVVVPAGQSLNIDAGLLRFALDVGDLDATSAVGRAMADALEERLLDLVFRGTASVATLPIGELHEVPTDDASTSASRVAFSGGDPAVTFGPPASGGAGLRVVSNLLPVTFTGAPPDTIATHLRLVAALGSSGLFHGPLAAPASLPSGGGFEFPEGTLIVRLRTEAA